MLFASSIGNCASVSSALELGKSVDWNACWFEEACLVVEIVAFFRAGEVAFGEGEDEEEDEAGAEADDDGDEEVDAARLSEFRVRRGALLPLPLLMLASGVGVSPPMLLADSSESS